MGTYLFASQPAMGHLNPMFAIARQLELRGHRAVFACPAIEAVEKAIAAKGFPLHKLRMPLSAGGLALLHLTSGFLETAFAIRMFFAGLVPYVQQLLPVLDEVSPDAVVTDFAFPGAGLAAEVRGVPHVVVYSAGLGLPGPGIPPVGSGLPIGGEWGWRGGVYRVVSGWLERGTDKRVNRARKKLGLVPNEPGTVAWLSSPWLTLYLTSEAIEAPRVSVPGTGFFIGPCFAGREGQGDPSFPFDRFATGRPKVYVSLGTVFNRKPAVFGRILDAHADGRCQLVVSAGGAFDALSARGVPDHVLLFPRVPQVEVLDRVDAVVSHGGNNTVNETLAAGRPLVVLPVGGEQGDNASRVEYLGAGLRADLNRSPAEEIGAKVRRLLEEPSFARRARECADALAKTDGPGTAASFIERVSTTRKPLARPAGYPLTVLRDSPVPWEEPPDGRPRG